MSKAYHGPVPITESDITMAREHLKDTLRIKRAELKLNKKKIKDHQEAAHDAVNPKSAAYNRGHIQGHIKDNKAITDTIKERETSMRTLKNVKPERTYNDVRKTKVAMMQRKAES